MKYIQLTQEQVAIVDDDVYEQIKKYSWHAHKNRSGRFYAIRRIKKNGVWSHMKMHREVMNAKEGEIIDHINCDSLDNRKSNLRVVSRSQNTWNQITHIKTSSKFKGVSWHKDRRKWQAYVTKDYKTYYLGLHEMEEDAARAYDKKAKELFGEFARLNFPEKEKEVS